MEQDHRGKDLKLVEVWELVVEKEIVLVKVVD
jgi:hypothetical protein